MKALDQRATFSRNLVRFRKAKHLTQAELARLTGMERALIGHYETRPIDPPSSVLLLLAKALGVSMNDLVEEHPAVPTGDPSQIDPRTFRKVLEIATLPPEDRAVIYGILNKLKQSSKKTQTQDDNHTT